MINKHFLEHAQNMLNDPNIELGNALGIPPRLFDDIIKTVLDSDSAHPRANAHKGFNLEKDKHYKNAIPFLEKGAKIESDKERVHIEYALANCLMKVGRYKEALHYAESIAQQYPSDFIIQFICAYCWFNDGDRAKGLATFRENVHHLNDLMPLYSAEIKDLIYRGLEPGCTLEPLPRSQPSPEA